MLNLDNVVCFLLIRWPAHFISVKIFVLRYIDQFLSVKIDVVGIHYFCVQNFPQIRSWPLQENFHFFYGILFIFMIYFKCLNSVQSSKVFVLKLFIIHRQKHKDLSQLKFLFFSQDHNFYLCVRLAACNAIQVTNFYCLIILAMTTC